MSINNLYFTNKRKAPIDDFFSRPENNVFNKIFDEQNNNDNTKSECEFPFLSLINAGSSCDNNNNNNQSFNDNNPKYGHTLIDSNKSLLKQKLELHKSKPINHQSKLLGKKRALFTAIQSTEIMNPKKIKLIQNRMSAQKSREKKKEYIKDIENELNKTRRELNEYKQIINKNKVTDAYINQMKIKEEKALNQILPDSELEEIKREYKINQSILLNQLLNQLLQAIIPLELKLFYSKFLKLEEINEKDTIESIETKTIKNINILKELYSFTSVTGDSEPKKEGIPWKLFSLFVNAKLVIDTLKYYL